MGSYVKSILPITLWDVLDIAVLAVLIYKGITLIKETRAAGLLKGIAFMLVAYVVMNYMGMKAMAFIMENVFDVGLLALIVLFQQEIRRMLEKIGHSSVTKIPVLSSITSESTDSMTTKWNNAIEAICDACEDLSATTTGALIVIERETKLGEQIDTGTVLNAAPSKELFGNIFFKNTPLHDGAVIMRDGVVLAAACFLPKPQKEETINKALGSRHRAAIGMSENSDAIVVVVSEETGTISVAENGNLERSLSRDGLKKLLRTKLIPEKPSRHGRPQPIQAVEKKLFNKKKSNNNNSAGGSENE
ncbi:MAG: diadenylate cyclase CdaA [Oscillospiraceae bacterium]|nr:diadenylate cyclase CdaA [Oscillospiraceae bacterium]